MMPVASFPPVGAPAGDAGRGEQRRVHITPGYQHAVNEAGGHEVDFRAHGDRLCLRAS